MRFALIIAVLLSSVISFAQVQQDLPENPDPGAVWVVETSDGSVYRGTVEEWTSDAVILKTSSLGEITIPKTEIVAIAEANRREVKKNRNPESLLQGRYRHAHRYLVTPSAYSLEKGEWHYQNFMIFYNQINYGVTDHFTLGAGAIPFPLFSPLWLTAKGSIPVVEDRLNIGINALAGGITYTGLFFGTVYANATIGNQSNNISGGVGYAFALREWTPFPTFVLAGTTRVGKKVHLTTENFIVAYDGDVSGLFSFGGRAGFEKVSFDFGFYFTTTSDLIGPFFFPLLGVGVPIN